MGTIRIMATGLLAASLLQQGAFAQKTIPGCSALAESDFKLTALISRNADNQIEEPVKMALDMDDQGRVDIYFVQRYGKIRKFAVESRTLTTIGTLPVEPVQLEDGVTGIILDPGFKSNRWLYLYYTSGTAAAFNFHLSRFHLDGAGMIDMASEKPILIIPAGKGKSHTGGSMRFDAQGVLYLGVGENEGAELSSANTNDLRGKILRFKPINFPDTQKPAPGVGGTYTIPAGNLFQASDKTRPEIYIMGNRNPYTISLDNRTGRLAWGDIGPNGTDTTEEHDITTKPGNFGYPYYAGNQVVVNANPGTPEKPINANAKNTGLRELPPAQPPANAYLRSASITGPIFRYDDAPKNSTVKLPPQFDGLWFISDYNTSEIDTIRLDASGTKKAAMGKVFRNFRLDRPLDFQQGPDGALYAVNYAGYFGSVATTGLVRIEYAGDCRPDPVSVSAGPPRVSPGRIDADGFVLETEAAGNFSVRILDLGGRERASFQGRGSGRYDLRGPLEGRAGVFAVRLASAAGILTRTLVLASP